MLMTQEQVTDTTYRFDSAHVLVSLPCPGAAGMCLQAGDDVDQAAVLHALDPAPCTRLDLDGCLRLPHVLCKSAAERQCWKCNDNWLTYSEALLALNNENPHILYV